MGGSDTSDLIAAGLQRIATIINSSKLCEDNLFQENLQSDSEYFVHTHIACHQSLTLWINVQVQEHHPHHWADLTADLHTSLSHGSTSLRFHLQRDLSVNVFHDILGRPGSRFASICMANSVLIAPLERSTCWKQRSFFFLRITSRSSISSCTNRSFDLIVAKLFDLTLQF